MNSDPITISQVDFIEQLSTASPSELRIVACRLGLPIKWRTAPRSLPDHIIWLINQGGLEGQIEKTPVTLTKDSFILISPKAVHEFHSTPPNGKLVNYSLRFILTKKDKLLRIKQPFLAPKQFAHAKPLLHQIYMNEAFPNPLRFAKTRALLTTLLIDLFTYDQSPSTESGHIFGPRQLDQLDRYLTRNVHLNPSPADLAKLFGYSPDYFSRLFRAQFGIPPREWLKKERLQRSALLLVDSSDSIKQIADKFGFEDQRFFSQQFKKQFHMSPREYRWRAHSSPSN